MSVRELRFGYHTEQEIRESGDMSRQLACTYLPGGYHVTTCFRKSSAAVSTPPWYYETFIWKDTGGDERELVGESNDGHIAACEVILRYGEWLTEEQICEREEAV